MPSPVCRQALGLVLLVCACGPDAGPEPEAAPAAVPPGAAAAASERCWSGEIRVTERHRFGPPKASCRHSEGVTWTGRAEVLLHEGPVSEEGWLIPRSALAYQRVDWEIEQTGFEEVCVRREAAPDLAGRETREVRRVVEDARASGHFEPRDASIAGYRYHTAPGPAAPLRRPTPEPRLAPDKFRPGQYEFDLPTPCRTLEASGTRFEGERSYAAPHGVRCSFGSPVYARFRPGRTLADHERHCPDEARVVEDGGTALRGTARCNLSLPSGGASELEVTWDLAPVDCETDDSQ